MGNATSKQDHETKKCSDLFKKRQMQIIKKATKLFMNKGYAQTTMRDISKATGINLGDVYNYISS